MAASATPTDVAEFLAGPLVTWLATCVKKPESLQVYETFYDGGPITEVLLQINPKLSQPVPTSSATLPGLTIATRVNMFHYIIKNIKSLYEELDQVVVALPNCVTIGRAPASKTALEQLQLLLLLLLGCAVQGPTKEIFNTRIKGLALDAQHDIAKCIKQVTEDQNVVLTLDCSEHTPRRLYTHVRSLVAERDTLVQQWVTDLGQEVSSTASASNATIESNHLADLKSRLRKQRQELEEKSEILLAECREELEQTNSLLTKLKAKNSDLLVEAERADELDHSLEIIKVENDLSDQDVKELFQTPTQPQQISPVPKRRRGRPRKSEKRYFEKPEPVLRMSSRSRK